MEPMEYAFGFWFFILFVLVGALLWTGTLRKRKISTRDRAFILVHWNQIEAHAKENPKNALVEADKLFHYALKKSGFRGSVSDILKKSGENFSNINDLWAAHKMRNRVVHEVGYAPSEKDARRCLGAFRTALKKMGIDIT